MHLALFNVKYSPNLGDGLLSECLERELQSIDASLTLVTLDLAGRTDYEEGPSGRRHLLALLKELPRPVRTTLTSLALWRLASKRLIPIWREGLRNADAAIIGGGNLFADADLNFPIKISCALRLVRDRKIPAAVHSVGVSDNWSKKGHDLFASRLKEVNLIDATVRDERSQSLWEKLLRTDQIAPAGLSLDPGLLTAKHYPATPTLSDKSVAIGLTHPVALAYHTANALSSADLSSWNTALVEAIVSERGAASLFANGSSEDQAYLSEFVGKLAPSVRKQVRVADRFASPSELAAFVSNCSLVISHRMHACIPAYSYGIPTIGLRWDPKLDSFFELSGRSPFLADPASAKTGDMLSLVARALSSQVDPVRKAELVQSCEQSIRRLLDIIRNSVQASDGQQNR